MTCHMTYHTIPKHMALQVPHGPGARRVGPSPEPTNGAEAVARAARGQRAEVLFGVGGIDDTVHDIFNYV